MYTEAADVHHPATFIDFSFWRFSQLICLNTYFMYLVTKRCDMPYTGTFEVLAGSCGQNIFLRQVKNARWYSLISFCNRISKWFREAYGYGHKVT